MTQHAANLVSSEVASSDSGEPLRILHLVRSADPQAGGPTEGVIRYCEALKGSTTCRLATLDPPGAPFLTETRVKVYPLGVGDNAGQGRGLLGRFGHSPLLESWLRRNARNYDCVVINGIWDFAAVGAARVLRGLDVPYFVFTHGMLEPWFQERHPVEHFRKQLSWLLFQGPLLRGARRVFFTTEEELVLARKARFNDYLGAVVGYGTADVAGDRGGQIRAFRAAAPAVADRSYLLFLGRIHPKKGCDLLVKAFAKVASSRPDLDLVIAGPDPMGWGDKLKRMAAEAGVGRRVHFPGVLLGDIKWGAFRGAEAFVLPSHQENFSITVVEALACATPVLITDEVNIWREVQAAGAGFVAADDQAGADRLLQRWISLDNLSRARMGVAARTCFQRHFDVTQNAATLVNAIKAAL